MRTDAPSHPRSAPARSASHGAAVAVAAQTAPVADPDETLTYAAPQAATDSKTEQSLRGGRMVPQAAKPVPRRPKPPWWQDRRVQIAAGAGGLLLVLLGVWVIVRDKGGKRLPPREDSFLPLAVASIGGSRIPAEPGAEADGVEQAVAPREAPSTKSEIRSTKSETSTKDRNPND